MADTALFSTAEARAFDKAQLASETDYLTATITAKEEEIRQWLAKVCGVDFVRTEHDEYYDGDDSDYIVLRWPKVASVTSIKVDGDALDATEIDPTDYADGLAIDEELGVITRRSGIFDAGWRNVQVVYTAGYEYVPKLIKRAALQIAVNEIPAQNVPWAADGYDAGGTSYSFASGDGFGGRWSNLPDVVKAIRLYMRKEPGIA